MQVKKGLWLLNAHVSIAGVSRKSTVRHDATTSGTRERELEVEERIANVELHGLAQTLANRIRSTVQRYGTNLDGYGQLADTKAKDAFEAEIERLRVDIDTFNAVGNNPHRIRVRTSTMDVGQSFGSKDLGVLYRDIVAHFEQGAELLRALDATRLSAWLQAAAKMPSLLPGMVAQNATSAIEAVRLARMTVAKMGRDRNVTPVELTDPAAKRDFLECGAVRDALEALDGAAIWCAPPTEAERADMAERLA
jgi:hypothetical protein